MKVFVGVGKTFIVLYFLFKVLYDVDMGVLCVDVCVLFCVKNLFLVLFVIRWVV